MIIPVDTSHRVRLITDWSKLYDCHLFQVVVSSVSPGGGIYVQDPPVYLTSSPAPIILAESAPMRTSWFISLASGRPFGTSRRPATYGASSWADHIGISPRPSLSAPPGLNLSATARLSTMPTSSASFVKLSEHTSGIRDTDEEALTNKHAAMTKKVLN